MRSASCVKVRVLIGCLALTLLGGRSLPAQTGSPAPGEPKPTSAADSRQRVEVLVVDEARRPVAGARVRRLEDGQSETFVTTDAKGLVGILLPPEPSASGNGAVSWTAVTLHATDPSGELHGFLPQSRHDRSPTSEPLRVTLKAPRDISVRVIDKAGAAVADAIVVVREVFGHDLTQGRTNDEGTARIRFPADAALASIYAFASGKGFENWSGFTRGRSPVLPAEIVLTLNGAQSVQVRTLDRSGKPVAGVVVYPEFLLLNSQPPPGHNFINSRVADVQTIATGLAVFDWLPSDLKGVSIRIRSDDYFLPDPKEIEAGFRNGDRDFRTELVRLVSVSGRVADPSGKPVAGTVVHAWGVDEARARSLMRVHERSTRTAADGTYVLKLAPRFTYAMNVLDEDWASVVRSGVRIDESRTFEGLDFALVKGTLVQGTVTAGANRGYVVNEIVRVGQKVGDVSESDDGKSVARWFARVPEPAADQVAAARRFPLMFPRAATTDGGGRYRIRLGPGDYELQMMGMRSAPPTAISVSGESVIVRDFTLELQAPGLRGGAPARREPAAVKLTGEVVGPDGMPVKDAVVRGIHADARTRIWRQVDAKSDAAGKFELGSPTAIEWLLVSSADGAIAGLMPVAPGSDSATVKLAPTATAVGRLIDRDAPAAGVRMYLQLRLESADGVGRTGGNSFLPGIRSTAAADGRVVFAGLIPGQSYSAIVDSAGSFNRNALPSSTSILTTFPIKPERAGKIDLGYLETPVPARITTTDGRPTMGVDIAALATRLFDGKTPISDRISASSADAIREDRRVMLVLGDPALETTRTVLRLFDGRRYASNSARRGNPPPGDELERQLSGFVRHYVDVKDREAVAYLTKTYRLDVARFAPPALVVLGKENQVVAVRWFGSADDPSALEIDALREFVKDHATAPRDATELLAEAIRRAGNENKRVLLQHSGTDHYPSRLLGRFIARQRALFERDYVLVDVDTLRMTNGGEVIRRYRSKDGSLPWTAILDADGKKLADSDGPDGNSAFPAEPESVDWFIDRMLKPTTRTLTAAELEALRTALGR